MGQVGSGNTATEPAVANDEFAVSFTDGSPNGDHPMEVGNTTMSSDDVSHADEANQPSKKRSRLDNFHPGRGVVRRADVSIVSALKIWWF